MTKYAPYPGRQAIKRARGYLGKRAYSNMCQAFVVTMYGTGAVGDWDGDRDADAVDGWKKAKARGRVVTADKIKSYKSIPAGVALYWTGGSRGYGHAAISIGDGQMISTDAGKAWGYVGQRDIGYISRVWKNGLKFVGYVIEEGNGYTLTDPPGSKPPAVNKPSVKPTPSKKYHAWYAVWLRNLGGLNDHGKKSWGTRIPKVERDISKTPYARGSIQAFLELPRDKLNDWDKRMSRQGYKRAAGSAGRYIYVPRSINVRAGGVFDLRPRLKNDDKQAAWALVDMPQRGNPNKVAPALVVVGHLEHEKGAAADRIRVGQAEDMARKATEKAKSYGLGASRVLILADTNSHAMVKNALGKKGWGDCFDLASNTTNEEFFSYVGWNYKLVKDSGYDFGFVKVNRPVIYAGYRRGAVPGVLDHLPLCVVTGWGNRNV